jgi:Immunity protein 7
MMIYFGWAVVQAPRDRFVTALAIDETRQIRDEIWTEDERLHAECRKWLEACADEDPFLIWPFAEQLNNHGGMLQFMSSRNHRNSSSIWRLMEFLVSRSRGTHGLVHLQDDEDPVHPMSFRVWRMLDGSISEHEDVHFSPFGSTNAFGEQMWERSLGE